MTRFPFVATLLVSLGLFPAGCRSARKPPASPAVAPAFVDITEGSGIRFTHHAGMRGKKYMPETVGSGVGFLDYDGDGLIDVFFVNSTDWPGAEAETHSSALYRNLGGGRFEDVTLRVGLRRDVYGMGVACADYDNDGDTDLLLTCIGPNVLYRNDGGRFTDVTAAAGVAGRPVEPGGLRWKWSASAAWLDYDRDGLLDLMVLNYVKWTPKTDPYCGSNGRKEYCPPNNFEGVASLLYHNKGKGRFEDVSEKMGIAASIGKSFGIAVADYNGDGWPDVAVANDTMENFLFLNQAGKGFQERGVEANIAFSTGGVPRAGMGMDAADWKNDGTFGLAIGNFSREGLALYEYSGDGLFREVSYPAQLAQPSLLSLTFGLFFFDANLDGFQDVFAANGHIDDFVQMKDAAVSYEQLPLLFLGSSRRVFTPVTDRAGPAMAVKRVLRGCAHADLDNDGDEEIGVVWNNRRGEIWRNDLPPGRQWIGLRLRGVQSNRDGIGAVVRVKSGGTTQTAVRHSGGSFLSENDPRLHFGLGDSAGPIEVQVTWPTGKVATFTGVRPGAYWELAEDRTVATPVSATIGGG